VNAVAFTDLLAPGVAGGGVDLAEVVFDAARNGDQQQPGRLTRSPEPVWAARGRKTKLPAAASKTSLPQRTDSSPCST
jgi:hypothetical protein